jgi:hypothetical protein
VQEKINAGDLLINSENVYKIRLGDVQSKSFEELTQTGK